jgi:hypothetical protein
MASAGRFLTIDDVAAELNISNAQCYALLRAGTLQGMQVALCTVRALPTR